jgi:anti-sigma regulatory factor (Ser/Thr protein kinase)
VILALLRRRKTPTSTTDVAQLLGVTRQAAHRRLRRLAQQGSIAATGAGRSSRWELARGRKGLRLRTLGLAEDRVWDELGRTVPGIARLGVEARHIAAYAFTEMLNNAIEHSGSKTIDVSVEDSEQGLAFLVVDRGVGAFETVRAKLGLQSALDALGEISKGKTTTMPDRHTGEGLFFTSKAVHRFVLEANRLAWVVDTERGDFAAEPSAVRVGTRVRFVVPLRPKQTLEQVFSQYTEQLEFTKTRVVVRVFVLGTEFVSRSEARRLLSGLERFRDVVLDFERVSSVGQGFCDEIFRVWTTAHSTIRLGVENAAPTVAFMIDRARGARTGPADEEHGRAR